MLCLTATAKPEVVRDITDHFRERLGIELGLFDDPYRYSDAAREKAQVAAVSAKGGKA